MHSIMTLVTYFKTRGLLAADAQLISVKVAWFVVNLILKPQKALLSVAIT